MSALVGLNDHENMSATPTAEEESACFQADVRDLFATMNQLELIDSVEDAYGELIGRRLDFVHYGPPDQISESRRAAANLAVIGQAQLHRAERLMASSGTMISQRNLYGMALLIRGHFESTAILGYFCNRVSSFIGGHIAFDTVTAEISRATTGGRHELFEKMPEPISIMTAIEKADRYLKHLELSETKGMLADCYAWLSEFAHPNFNSIDAAIRLSQERGGFEFRHGGPLSEGEIEQLGYLDISAGLFVRLFDELSALSEKAFGPSHA